jgi:hypothetical protein
MTLRERAAVWLMPGADKPRAVPRRIHPLDSVTVISQGTVSASAAAEFSADLARWRAGEGDLYLPEGSRIETTRRAK